MKYSKELSFFIIVLLVFLPQYPKLPHFSDQDIALQSHLKTPYMLSSQDSVRPPEGIVGWWPGDDNAKDIIGGNDGVLHYDTNYAPGLVGNAFSFDGADDDVEITSTILNDLQSLTIEGWVYHDTLPNKRERYVTLPGDKAFLCHDREKTLQFYILDSVSLQSFEIRAYDVLQKGVFHHVAGSYNGRWMRLYLDGEEVARIRIIAELYAGMGAGFFSWESDESLDGLLDEISIYNRALSITEIQEIYEAGSRGKCKPPEPGTSYHNIGVTLDTPMIAYVDNGISINPSVFNDGSFVENNVVLSILVNNSIIETHLFTSISLGSTKTFSYTWTPVDIGTSNITVFAEQVDGETYLCDNFETNILVTSDGVHSVTLEPIIITSNEDFQTQGWPGDGSVGNPYIISRISISDTMECISISNTNVHFIIEECYFECDRSFESYAVSITFVENAVVKNNTLYYAGIWCEFTEQVRIEYNTIRYPHIGIDHVLSEQSVISHNVIYRANSEGIFSESLYDCVITGNQITRCDIGILILGISFCSFTYNYIRSNWDYGINVEASHQNRIFGNYLDNYNNAMDDGTNNEWDNGENIGNFWSNADSSDPVQVGGTPGNIDHYPLLRDKSDYSLPLIGYSPTLLIESPIEATFAWIVWSDPGTYELFQNNSMIEEGDWLGSGAFKLQLFDLPDGLYNYTLSINDQANEIATNQKFILVPDYLLVTPPESPQNLAIAISENSIELDWEAPVFDGNLPVIGYNVYRGSRPGAFTLLVELGVVFNYTDNSITIGTINIYAVHAVNALGEGLPSNIVSNLESHNPIVISSNEDFQTQGWPGDGTEENPFRISVLNITSNLTCINISNVNVFVEIEGCIFVNNPDEYHYGTFGIYLENVTNTNIRASYTSGKDRGIFFTQSTNCTVNDTFIDGQYQGICIENSRGINVTDTTMKNEYGWFGYGIYIWQSRNAYVSNCTFFDIDNGIFIDSSILCQISDCDFSLVYQGIFLYYSASCLVYACTMTDLGGAGIRLRESVNCAFSNITLIGDGVSISGNNITTWNHMFNNVTIDNKLLGFFFDTVGATINATKYSQLFIVYCQEVSVEGHYDANMSYGMHVAFSDGLQIIDVSLSELILENTTNSRVYNITSIGKSGDIIISLCEDLLFENLTFQREYWQWGRIRFTDSDRITIRDSIIRTRDDAISLYGTNDCVLEKLVIDFNWRGIFIDFSRNCTIRNVALTSTWSAYGITLEYTTESILEDVTLIFCGVEIIGYELEHWIHTFNNVTANGKQLGYFYQVEYRTIEGNDYAQLFIVDSHDIIVQNASFSNITMGLQFAYSDNCRVTDVELSDLFGYAPNLFSCESIIIENLSFHDNSNPFIIQTSSDILIHHSQFNDSYGGIDVSVSSLNCTIVENSFENADTAIRISDSIGCSISRNSIINGWRGFALYGLELSYITDNQIVDCYEGIRLQYSTNNYVTRNTVRRVYRGLRIVGGQENQITNNRIFDCRSIGIYVESEERSRFTYNVISNTESRGIDLNYGSSNIFYGNLLHNYGELGAHDDGESNQWDDGIEIGNCWELAQDDGPYQIEGGAGSVDNYPIYVETIDINTPVISSPPDIILAGTENETYIPWIVWSTPGAFEIYIDDVLSETYAWSGSGSLFTELVNIGFGNHTYTLVIYDAFGVNSSDSVFVVVPISISFMVQIAAACAGGIVIIGLVVVDLQKKRRIKILSGSSSNMK